MVLEALQKNVQGSYLPIEDTPAATTGHTLLKVRPGFHFSNGRRAKDTEHTA